VNRPPLPEAFVATRVIAVARRIDPARVSAVAAALGEGGVEVIEVTLDGAGALDSIGELTRGHWFVGAGTVMSVAEAEAATDAGAKFVVSPHTDTTIVAWAVERGIPVMAGAFTPTEVVAAWAAGVSAVKVFPASVGGPRMIRALRAPLGDLPLIPTGGIDGSNAGEFIAAGAVAVGVGGWLTDRPEVADITARARQLVAVCAH
jgi:2-dehydro-3-deoxyphosphogluconate aldolase/(4S)-4-hydroxy-2-oxoglutarate aldolase